MAMVGSHAQDGSVPTFKKNILGEDVYEHLRSLIMTSAIEPDQPLRIEVLARELGVSPTPVREALLKLQSDSLVTKRGSKGYFSNPVLTMSEFDDLYEFRAVVEPWACGQAAARVTPEDAAALRQEIEFPAGFGVVMDFSTYRAMQEHDHRFHDLLFRMAGNNVAREAFERTHVHVSTFRIYMASQLGPLAIKEHAAIAEAVITGDEDAARATMLAHLTRSRDRLRPYVDR